MFEIFTFPRFEIIIYRNTTVRVFPVTLFLEREMLRAFNFPGNKIDILITELWIGNYPSFLREYYLLLRLDIFSECSCKRSSSNNYDLCDERWLSIDIKYHRAMADRRTNCRRNVAANDSLRYERTCRR